MKKIFIISVLMLTSIAVFGQDANYILGMIRNLPTFNNKDNEANAEWEYHNDVYATNFEHKIDTVYATDRVAQQTSKNTATIKEVTKISQIVESKTFLWHIGSYYKVIITEGEVKNIFYVDELYNISEEKPEAKEFKCKYVGGEDDDAGVVLEIEEEQVHTLVSFDSKKCFFAVINNNFNDFNINIFSGSYTIYHPYLKRAHSYKDGQPLNPRSFLKRLMSMKKKKDMNKNYSYTITSTTKKKKRHSEKIDDLYF